MIELVGSINFRHPQITHKLLNDIKSFNNSLLIYTKIHTKVNRSRQEEQKQKTKK